MKKLLQICLGIGILGCTGCAGLLNNWVSSSNSQTLIFSPEVYREQLQEWINKDINSLLLVWGPPSSVFNMPNGNIMYTWVIQDNKVISHGSGNSNDISGSVFSHNWSVQEEIKHSCRTSFIANGIKIINFSFKGDMCIASEPVEDVLFGLAKGVKVHLVLDGGREVTGIFGGIENDFVQITTDPKLTNKTATIWERLDEISHHESIPRKAVLKAEKIN